MTSASYWRQARQWNKEAEGAESKPRIFPSLCDWLDEEVPIEWLTLFLAEIFATPNLNWLLLTKRPENWRRRIEMAEDWDFDQGQRILVGKLREWRRFGMYPRNVWMGTSVENQDNAHRIESLLSIPAHLRFLSIEPMLGPVMLPIHLAESRGSLHWIIYGGESGPKARKCDVEWIRHGIQQCRGLDIQPFVKQLGSLAVDSRGDSVYNRMLIGLDDPKGGNIDEWPKDLRIREIPGV